MKRKNLRKVGKTTNNTDIETLPVFPLDKPSRLQVKETVFNTYDYKLFGEITEVDDYFDLIDALNYASPDDEFFIPLLLAILLALAKSIADWAISHLSVLMSY